MKIIAILFTLFSSLAISQHTEGEWLGKFDAIWYNGINNATYANYASTMNYAQSTGELQEHYYAAWGIEGVIAAWQASGKLEYLNDAILITSEIISNAVPVMGGSYLGWPATKTGSVRADGQPLWESYYWRHIATLLRIMHQSPILRSTNNGDLPGTTYQDNYNSLLDFIETNIWDKWSIGGNPNQSDIYRIRTHMASHWARIGMELHIITGEQKYKDVFDNISWKGFPPTTANPGASLRDNLIVTENGYIWHQDWEQTVIQDTDHGSDVINFIVEAVQNGYYWTEADLERFSYQFDNVIWNNDSPVQWNEFVDGSGSATGGSVSLHEWINLGRYSQSLQDRIDAAYWRPNPSFPQFSPGGNHAMATGIILLNISDLDGTTVYPEVKSVLPTITLTERKAFPDAWGFGKNATGGRGGTVIQVTNLNNSGAGSLRAALTASGPRTVVFRIGGTIELSSPIWIGNGDLTIAGETAPGDGILIKGNKVEVNAGNVIIRNIRFRVGEPTSGTDVDAFSITANTGEIVENVIVDHCSFSWADDENFNIRANHRETAIVRNITVQNSLMAEATHNMLMYLNVQNVSLFQNLFALASERNPHGNNGYPDVFRAELINNLIYGWRQDATDFANGLKYTIKNNKYKISTEQATVNLYTVGGSAVNEFAQDDWTYAYVDGNIIPDGYLLTRSRVAPYLQSTPFLSSDITGYPASEIEDKILSHVGASLSSRDAVDTRIIGNYNSGTGVIAYSGTFPTIADGTPYPDTNNDGISDIWATLHGITSATQVKATYTIGGKTIVNYAGYTALEIFLADLAGDFDRLPIEDGPQPDPDPQPGKGRGINLNILLTLE